MTPVRRLRVRYPSDHESDEAPGWDAPRPPVPASDPAPRVAEPVGVAPASMAPPVAATIPAPPPAAVTTAAAPVTFPAATEAPAIAAPPSAAAATAQGAVDAATPAGPPGVAESEATLVRRRRRRYRRLLAWAFGLMLPVVAFATGVLVFNGLVMPKLIHGGGDVEVPDLTHLTLEQAEQALTPLDLQLSRAGERFDPAVPRGFVLSQDPGAGTQVRGRRRVSVMVSLGEEFSSVPELRGESERGAFALLASAGLRAGGIARAPSENVGEGLVVTTDPPGASVLPHDQPVALLISTGAGQETYVMPDLVGRQVISARRQLEAFGLRVLIPPAAPSMGTIVSQSPAPGSRITRTTSITIQASGRMIR